MTADTAAVVYRACDEDGDLLYIGSTVNWDKRWRQHKATARWWEEMAVVHLMPYDSVKKARVEEAYAVGRENPRYNVQHSQRRSTRTKTKVVVS